MSDKILNEFNKLDAAQQQQLLAEMKKASGDVLREKLLGHLVAFRDEATGCELDDHNYQLVQQQLNNLAVWFDARTDRIFAKVAAASRSYSDLVEEDVIQYLKKVRKPVNKRQLERCLIGGSKFDPDQWKRFSAAKLDQAGGKGAGVLWKIKK
tara:strand:+ start:1373 stop:1831 length:459 start_codon:yes stop_codon:yes gene_type:complete